MKLLKGLGTGLCLTVLGVIVAPNAKADEWNQKTTVTFSAPIEVPGVGQHILPAGTYVFKLMESPADRTIVQIFNVGEDHVYTTILAIPNFRLKATDKTVMTFRERPAGEPEALKAWFYPGREWGEQFVYERPRAIQLAKETNETVLSTPVALDTASADVLKTAPVEAVTPTGDMVETTTVVDVPPVQTAAVAPAPAPEPAPVETVAVAPAPAPVASLPKTASNLPLIGLAGLLMLGGGFVLMGRSKAKA
jgi:LPXTG-motif cell wall-anchored protein